MKKILIVDDEYIVRLGLKTIVDWAGFGYAVSGEAVNGKEALDFFEKNPVDVILTDIKMPVMDGLELTRKIRAKNKRVHIIILSHYDEFSYAQEAVQLGAFRYILKSELTKTNLETVLKSLHFSSEEPEKGEEKTRWKEQWEDFIEKTMLQTFTKKISFQLPRMLTPFSDTGEYVVFSAACRTTTLLSDARDKFPRAVSVLFDEAFEKLVSCGRYHDDDFQFIAAAAADTSKGKGEKELWIAEKIIKPCVQIVKNIRQYYDVYIFIGVSSSGKSDNCERLVEEAHQARINCFFSAKLFVDAYDPAKNAPAGRIPQKGGMVSYAKLTALIDSGKKEAMLEYIQNVFRNLRVAKDYTEVYDAFIDFLSVGKLIHGKFQLEKERSLSENKFRHDTFFDLPFIGDVEMYIYELYLSLLSTTQNGKASYSRIVKKCIDFIHSDYELNIGLAEAAAKAGVSHSYLSFIFKQETGVNFNAAITQYRIEKAKELLADTNLRIYQVAGKVGFSNPYYFSKVFREIAGCTCKEYRDTAGK